MLFYLANSFSCHFWTPKNFRFFSQSFEIFLGFEPIVHRWKKCSRQKMTFECLFTAQIPFQTISGLRKMLEFYLKNLKFLHVLTTIVHRWKKWSQQKNHLWVLFYGANSISYSFRTPKILGFLKNFNFLFSSTLILHRWNIMESTKNQSWLLFYSAKSISCHSRSKKWIIVITFWNVWKY